MSKNKHYSKSGSIFWAVRNLWYIDHRLLILHLVQVPVLIIIPLAGAYFSKYLINGMENALPFGELAYIVTFFIILKFTFEILSNFIKSRINSRQYYPTSIYQSRMTYAENFTMDFEATEKQNFKELSGYAWRDACSGRSSPEFILHDLSQVLINFSGIITYASLLTYINPVIFVVVIFTSLLSYFTSMWQNKYYEKNKHNWEKEQRKADYIKNLSRNFALAKDIKLYALEDWLNKMLSDYRAYIIMWNKRCNRRGLFAKLLAGLMTLIQNTVAYVILTGMFLEGRISAGDFVFYFGIIVNIARFLSNVAGSVAELSKKADKLIYYRRFFDYPCHQNHEKGCVLPCGMVSIELRDVWYKYDGADDFTLKGINLTIQAGENLALVGVNGAGKTTLVKLICGLYTPTKGEILVNGRPIYEYNIEEYYSMISAVFQDIKPVCFTMFEYVASHDLTRPTAREDVIVAMKMAGIWDKISSLENGIDTHLVKGVYNDGIDLSGGEMQKLVLARAIYKNGNILILDEPTAALDPIAENNIYRKYRDLTLDKTSIYISHRFASTRFCDRIILLDNGTIAEIGTHDELMLQNGKYAYMFEIQAKYYKEGEVNA